MSTYTPHQFPYQTPRDIPPHDPDAARTWDEPLPEVVPVVMPGPSAEVEGYAHEIRRAVALAAMREGDREEFLRGEGAWLGRMRRMK